MRIERVETFHFVGPVDRPYGPSCAYSRSRDAIIVKLTADDGTVGWGETYAISEARAAIDHQLGPALIGRDPIEGRRLWADLWGPNFGHSLAISAVDIALADLRGKALGLSLTRLYGGGFRDRVQAYASGNPYYEGVDPETHWIEDAVALAEQGFRAIKVRIGRYPPERELPLLARMREALPDHVTLMADANAAYTLHTALRVSRVLDELGFAWLEEPIREGDYEAYEVLTAQSATPIAAAEILLDRSAAGASSTSAARASCSRTCPSSVASRSCYSSRTWRGSRGSPPCPTATPAASRSPPRSTCARSSRTRPPSPARRRRCWSSRRRVPCSTPSCSRRPSGSTRPTAWSRCPPGRAWASRSTRTCSHGSAGTDPWVQEQVLLACFHCHWW